MLTIPPHFEKHFDDLKSRTWRPVKALVTEKARGTAVYGAKRVRISGDVLLHNIVQLAIVPYLKKMKIRSKNINIYIFDLDLLGHHRYKDTISQLL